MMKRIDTYVLEVSVDEFANIHNGTYVLIYNSLTYTFRLATVSDKFRHSLKFSADFVHYFLFDDPNFAYDY